MCVSVWEGGGVMERVNRTESEAYVGGFLLLDYIQPHATNQISLLHLLLTEEKTGKGVQKITGARWMLRCER